MCADMVETVKTAEADLQRRWRRLSPRTLLALVALLCCIAAAVAWFFWPRTVAMGWVKVPAGCRVVMEESLKEPCLFPGLSQGAESYTRLETTTHTPEAVLALLSDALASGGFGCHQPMPITTSSTARSRTRFALSLPPGSQGRKMRADDHGGVRIITIYVWQFPGKTVVEIIAGFSL